MNTWIFNSTRRMGYRIVRITNLYNEYLKQYYATFPTIKEKSFKQQHDHLVSNSFDTVSCFSKNLTHIGIEAFSIFTNATCLQDQWKIENKCDKSGRELIVEQIKALQPHVVWLDDITLIDRKWISYVRENIPSIKIITGHLCAPYHAEDIKNLKALDFLITCTPCLQKEFEKSGIETYMLYHGFEKSVLLENISENRYPETDLLFTGSLYTGGGFHKTRIEYLEKFMGADLPLKIYGSLDSTSKVLSKIAASYCINSFKKIGAKDLIKYVPFLNRYESYGDDSVRLYSKKLKASVLPPVYGLEQFKLLSKTKICFNIHGEIAKGCAGNARLFEATGIGTCLVTDWKENLSELFDLEKEVVTYKSKEECVDKIKWLLQNLDEARKISAAGKARTLKDHTVQKRVDLINEIFISKL
jgi:spore maturation protein CgeB